MDNTLMYCQPVTWSIMIISITFDHDGTGDAGEFTVIVYVLGYITIHLYPRISSQHCCCVIIIMVKIKSAEILVMGLDKMLNLTQNIFSLNIFLRNLFCILIQIWKWHTIQISSIININSSLFYKLLNTNLLSPRAINSWNIYQHWHSWIVLRQYLNWST